MWRSGKIWQDLLKSVKICNDQIYDFEITLTFCVAPEKDWLVVMEMFISEKAAREWMSLNLWFTKKVMSARHLKKICKIFVKDLKCTLLIYIWNVLCVGANISKLLSVMLDPNPNPDPDPWSWYWWHWSNPTPLLLMDSEVILAIWKVYSLTQSVTQSQYGS